MKNINEKLLTGALATTFGGSFMSYMSNGQYGLGGTGGTSPATRIAAAVAWNAIGIAMVVAALAVIYSKYGHMGVVFNFMVFVPFAAFGLARIYLALYSRYLRRFAAAVTFASLCVGWVVLDHVELYVLPSLAFAQILDAIPATQLIQVVNRLLGL